MRSRTETQEALYQAFKEHSSELYSLALLLTGDRERSVSTLTSAFELAGGHRVFKGPALPNARKLIAITALATVEQDLRESARRTQRLLEQDFPQIDDLPAHIWVEGRATRAEWERAALAVDVFQRDALLLTVFEGLPMEEVTLLLNADEATVRAAQGLGSMELVRNLALGRGWDPAQAVFSLGWSEPRRVAISR
jgi:hypothetical protein